MFSLLMKPSIAVKAKGDHGIIVFHAHLEVIDAEICLLDGELISNLDEPRGSE